MGSIAQIFKLQTSFVSGVSDVDFDLYYQYRFWDSFIVHSMNGSDPGRLLVIVEYHSLLVFAILHLLHNPVCNVLTALVVVSIMLGCSWLHQFIMIIRD